MFDNETFKKYLEAVDAASLVCVRHRDQNADQETLELHGEILRSHVRDAVAYCRGRRPNEVESVGEILREHRNATYAWNYYATHRDYGKGTGPVWAAEALPPPVPSSSIALSAPAIAEADRVSRRSTPNIVPGPTIAVEDPAPMEVDVPPVVEHPSKDDTPTDVKMEGADPPRQRRSVRVKSKAHIDDSDAEYPNTLLPRAPPEPKIGTFWMKVENVVPNGSCANCTKSGGGCIIPYTIRERAPQDARDTRTRPYARITCHLCYTRHITCVWTNHFQPVVSPGDYIFEPLINFSAPPAPDEREQIGAALEWATENVIRKRKAASNPPAPSTAGTSAPVVVKGTRSRSVKPPITRDAKAASSKTGKATKPRSARSTTKKKPTLPSTAITPDVPSTVSEYATPATDPSDSATTLPKTTVIPFVLLDGMGGNPCPQGLEGVKVAFVSDAGGQTIPPPSERPPSVDEPITGPPSKKFRASPAGKSVGGSRVTSQEPRVVPDALTPEATTVHDVTSQSAARSSSQLPIPLTDIGVKDPRAQEIPYPRTSPGTTDEISDLSNRLAELTSKVTVIQASAIRGAKYDADASETRLRFKNLEKQTAKLMEQMDVQQERGDKMADVIAQSQANFDEVERRLDDLGAGQQHIASGFERQYIDVRRQVEELRSEKEGFTTWLKRMESEGKRQQINTRTAMEEHQEAFRVLDAKVTDLTNDVKTKYANIETVQGLIERMDLREDAYRNDRETWRKQTETWTKQTESLQTQSEALTAVLLHAIGGSLSGAYGPDTPLGRLIPQVRQPSSTLLTDPVDPPSPQGSQLPPVPQFVPAPPSVPAPPLPSGPPPRVVRPLPRRPSYTHPAPRNPAIEPHGGCPATIAEEVPEPRSSLDSDHRALAMEKAYINLPDEAPDGSSSMSLSSP